MVAAEPPPQPPPPLPDDELTLTAYRVSADPPIQLVPAQRNRDWIDATTQRFASRCLPLLIANQSGWWLLNSHDFTVSWDGTRRSEGLTVRYFSGGEPYPALSHFGHGVLTFTLPFLFRTPPGWNLLARGPANQPKDGVAPLEGVVETDWSTAAFTMNWQITRPGMEIAFAKGEPICMIVPQRRGELEGVQPAIRPVEEMADADKYQAWRDSRAEFLRELPDPQSPAAKAGWQRDYMLGRDVDGEYVQEHQRKLRLREFEGEASLEQAPGEITSDPDGTDPALKFWA
ncbi:MAG TPA: DUF6065 family protein [Actinocrinis sp.]|nr:DUF6065 family protein [Actinocrinis sp.]